MLQIIQNLKSGETLLEEVPAPQVRSGHILVRTTHSLVSLGTERMLVAFGKANLITKARQQPDKVKQVLDKVKSDGLRPTLEAVFNKLEQPLPLGYCNVGRVVAIGEGVSEFQIGDRVASNGQHAEFVCVPTNLAVKIPDEVTDEQACFTVIGAIGLQGIRLLNPTLGETIVVVGLGLIGLLTAELLIANGCQVIGYDFDANKVEIAKLKGIDAQNVGQGIDPVKYALEHTKGVGVDGVVITASSSSNEIIAQSARMSRKRGRIILVGVIGLDISRTDFYEKELTFQVSCSYGPGRYDVDYEMKGKDYPLPFVRWTERRNFEAILQTIRSGKLDVTALITERVPLNEYKKIYENMSGGNSIASILVYPQNTKYTNEVLLTPNITLTKGKGNLGIIGAGNFVQMTVLPKLKRTAFKLHSISSAGGVNSNAMAKKYGFYKNTTDYRTILADSEVDMILVATRHNLHSSIVIESLQAGKHVFVEKPLALNIEELNAIIAAQSSSNKMVTVGFNRRFSPHIEKMKQLLGDAPMQVIATMNAGYIPKDVWVQDMQIGGGRIVGEACHYIDLIAYLTGSKISAVVMQALGKAPDINTDNASILIKMENGDTGVINYFSNGHKSYSKERIEVYSQDRTLVMDNFIRLEGYGFKNFTKLRTKQDKGHQAQFELLAKRIVEGGEALISFDSIINTTQASFAALQSLQTGAWVKV